MLYKGQLAIDFLNNDIVQEPLNYWKDISEVPSNIIDFIKETTNLRVLRDFETEEYYCPNCLAEIVDDYCACCNYQKPDLNISKNIIDVNIKDKDSLYSRNIYYVFDIIDDQILIYRFSLLMYYNVFTKYMSKREYHIKIENVYHILKTGIEDILNNKYYTYEDYKNNIIDEDFNNTSEYYDSSFLYTENLDMLKYTDLYKYTSIWNLKEYYKKNNFSLASLTYNPIYCKQFEYLVKMKLYNLAASSIDMVNVGNSFKSMFGVEKKYYDFMKNIDIDKYQFKALRLYPTMDIELLNFVAENIDIFEIIPRNIRVDEVKKYIEKVCLKNYNIYDYWDYIYDCKELGLNLKDKNILFPSNFTKQYNKIMKDMTITNNPEINDNIKSLSDIALLNKYETDKYIIFPANSVESLIDESTQMSNCVRTYCNKVSENECQIYFLRHKNNIQKSYVTIEVIDGKITQARTKLNKEPSYEIMNVLKKWENTILPINNK